MRPIFMSLIRAKEAGLYDKFKKYFQERTLDVGCGDGEFAKMVWGNIDVGIDLPGSRMGEAARLKVYKEIKIFDGINIPYKKDMFKAVVANCVLEHVTNLDQLLKEINRVTKPRGYFLTTVMAKPWEEFLFGGKILGDGYKKWFRKAQDHRNLLTDKEWDTIFKKTGWKVMEKIGYLPEDMARKIEIWHYLSIGYLISYKLTGRWTWGNPAHILPINTMSRWIEKNTTPEKSGAIFYVLEKIKA